MQPRRVCARLPFEFFLGSPMSSLAGILSDSENYVFFTKWAGWNVYPGGLGGFGFGQYARNFGDESVWFQRAGNLPDRQPNRPVARRGSGWGRFERFGSREQFTRKDQFAIQPD